MAAIATLFVALGTGSAPAQEAAPPALELPDDNSALDQYVAALPFAGGKRPIRPGERGDPLPASVARGISDDVDRNLLATIATSPGLGAPARSRADGAKGSDRRQAKSAPPVEPRDEESGPGLLNAASEGLFGTEGAGRIAVLLLLLTSLGVAVAIRLLPRRATG